ncbi:ABC transporter substrate-binding protein [Kibdelosporangium lantanae]
MTNRRRFLGAVVAATAFPVTGCGLLSGKAEPEPERATIRLGAMPIVDVAPVYIASRAGYFRDEGVDIQITMLQGGGAGIPSLVNGELDVVFGNWMTFFTAQAKGTVDLRFVADGYRGGPGMFLVLVSPDSQVRSAKDLAGRKVAVNMRGSVSEFLFRVALKAQRVDPTGVQFAEMPFPDMQAALRRKDIDAAIIVEPFLTRAVREMGAVPVLDTMTGDADELPIGGYATTTRYANGNPATLDAFHRALARAQGEAADRAKVESVITSYANVDAATAGQLHLGSYPRDIDVSRLRTVVRLMRDNGMLDRDVDPGPMVR